MFSLDLNCLCQLQNGKGGGVLILKANMYINICAHCFSSVHKG